MGFLIDGSQGEGGGQILRTSMALAAITGTPITITSIRAGRSKPGLMRQHLAAVRAAAEVCGGSLDGAELGSTQLSFTPGAIRPGEYTFATGSAGSATLVLQTVLPILLSAAPGSASRLTLTGGTHNPHAPPFDYLDAVFLPQLRRMGVTLRADLSRHGFYPAGGGVMTVDLTAGKLAPLELLTRGERRARRATAICAGVPGIVAVRELDKVKHRLGFADDELVPLQLPAAHGPGNVLLIRFDYEHVSELFTAFGERGLSAEAVAEKAITEARDYLTSDAPVGPHLADQLLLPLALAGAGRFVTTAPSLHTTTNVAIIETFLPVKFKVKDLGKHRHEISIARSGVI